MVLRDMAFGGSAEIRTVTAASGGEARTLPDVETARIAEGSENTKDGTVTLTLPPQSFTVIEAAMTSQVGARRHSARESPRGRGHRGKSEQAEPKEYTPNVAEVRIHMALWGPSPRDGPGHLRVPWPG